MNDKNITFIVSYIQDSDLDRYDNDGLLYIGNYRYNKALPFLIHFIARETGRVFPIDEYKEAISIISYLKTHEHKIFQRLEEGKSIPCINWDDQENRDKQIGEWYKVDNHYKSVEGDKK